VSDQPIYSLQRTGSSCNAGNADFASGQRRAEPPGGHARLAAEHLGQMALVGEAGLLCNQCKRLAGLAQQAFGTFEPALDDVALRPNPSRLFERAAEVIGA
jgi:hypothetical protein